MQSGEQTWAEHSQNVCIGWRTSKWDKNREHVDEPKPKKAGTEASSLLQNKRNARTNCREQDSLFHHIH